MYSNTIGILEFSRRLRCNRRTVIRWIKSGKIPSSQIEKSKFQCGGRGNGYRFIYDKKLEMFIARYKKTTDEMGVPGRSTPFKVLRVVNGSLMAMVTAVENASGVKDLFYPLDVIANVGWRPFIKFGKRLKSERKKELIQKLESVASSFSSIARELQNS